DRYPEVAAAGIDPLTHFLAHGWRELRNPNADFDTAYYVQTYPDVPAAGLNPFFHYLTDGINDGRLAQKPPPELLREAAVAPAPSEKPRPPEVPDDVRAAVAPKFDAAYYLAEYPDISALGDDPLTHYMLHGWREGRNPNLDFDTAYYVAANPDVIAAGVNPFYHYIVAGIAEGRFARKPNAIERETIAAARPFRARLAGWARDEDHVPVTRPVLESLIGQLLPRQNRQWAISVSQDEYLRVAGGVQNCIADEQAHLNREGWSYIHLCPAQPLPVLAEKTDAAEFILTLSIDGKRIGYARASDLLEVLRLQLSRTGVDARMLLHSLLGHSPEILQDFAKLPQLTTYFWVHDFFSLCPNYPLLRNDVEFCGSPPLEANACQICVYGAERRTHWARVQQRFASVRPTVIAPSEAALTLWQKAGLAHRDAIIAPHVKFLPAASPRRSHPATEAVKVAFLGAPV